MNPDDIFNDAMAKFKQEQLDGGVTPEEYDAALMQAIVHKSTAMHHHGVSIADYVRQDPEAAAENLQAIILANDDEPPAEETDPDGTVDLDDLDLGEGGDK
jgi:hypothetical protein